MSFYSDLLMQLVEEQTRKLKPNEYLLSVYIATDHDTRLEIKRKLKSYLFENFHSNTKTNIYNNINQKIANMSDAVIDSLSELSDSIGIFAKIDIEKEDVVDNSFRLINMPIEVEEQFHIDKVYSLDNLFTVINCSYKAIVIHIEREKGELFRLEPTDFELISEEKNELLEFDLTQRNKKPSAFSDREKYLGGGEYNMQRRQEDENQNFLNQILDKVDSLKENFDYIVCIYSKNFNGTIDKVLEANKSRFGNPIILTTDKNLRERREIQIKALKMIDKHQTKTQKDLLRKSKEDYKNYVTGWEKIVEAARNRSIEILFIKPSAKKDGYIFENDFIYTNLDDLKYQDQIEKSIHTENILPWVIKNVIQSSGKIVFTKGSQLGRGSLVSAKLRY